MATDPLPGNSTPLKIDPFAKLRLYITINIEPITPFGETQLNIVETMARYPFINNTWTF